MFKLLFRPFYISYIILTFTISIIIIFPFVLLLSLFNTTKTNKLIFLILKYWAIIWLWVIEMRLDISGLLPPKTKYILISNHTSYIDSIALLAAVPFYFKLFEKRTIPQIPILSYIYNQLVIKMSKANDLKSASDLLQNNTSVLLFPEESINETEAPLKDFKDDPFWLSIYTQVDIIPILIPDTINRFHFSNWWKVAPGINRAVFLEPISPTGYTIEEVSQFKNKIFEIMDSKITKLRTGEKDSKALIYRRNT